MNKILATLMLLNIACAGCAQQKATLTGGQVAPAVAFPGAEGWGKYTSGGRGGKVYVVNTLSDNGPGSLRQALSEKGSRIITFAVSGTIHLETPLSIGSNTTLAGQSAPGGGICLADQPVKLTGNNIIIRYLRFRMGDRFQNKGKVAGGGADDALSSTRGKNIIIDHCSVSWSTDEVFSIYAGDSATVQWNIISEPLNYSYHFEQGDTDFERHGYGGIWGGRHLSAHHNLIAHCNSRTPRFDGIRNSPEERVDFQNNVLYNWGSNNIYAGEGGSYSLVANYFKPGPNTNNKTRKQIANPWDKAPSLPFGKWYVAGNVVEGAPEVTSDNWKGVRPEREVALDSIRMARPLAQGWLATETAEKAFEAVLRQAGATLPLRDTLDQRIVLDVRNGTGRIIDVQGGFPHGTPYAQTAKAWPGLDGGTAPADSDKDGMPDSWEQRKGLNPSNPADAVQNTLEKGYNNVEVYLNDLVKQKTELARK